MILDLITKLQGLFKAKDVSTTSTVFKLVTRYTVNLLALIILFILSTQLFGNAIHCFSTTDRPFSQAMELKCWLEGTYIYEELLNATQRKLVLKPGVGPGQYKKIEFKYYQWIVPLLLFQALCFYIPRGIWHMQEKGTMTKLLGKSQYPVITDEWQEQRKNLVAYIKIIKKKYHRNYAVKYLLCEFLTIVMIVVNMITMHYLFHGFWQQYLPAVAAFFRCDFGSFGIHAARLFPIQSKCDLDVFGPSGGIETRDALCILPQNVFNEKVFAVLYVWYIFLLICAIFSFFYFAIMFCFQILRILRIGSMLEKTASHKEIKEISANGDYGLWFTLSIYRQNMVPIFFQDVCQKLRAELKQDKQTCNLDFKTKLEDYDEIQYP